MSQQLEVTRQPGAALIVGGGDPARTAAAMVARRELIKEVREKVMVEGVHFGKVPGIPKPMLLKPGSEVLALTFGLSVECVPVAVEVDSEDVMYRVGATVKHIASGETLAYCERVCSTREKKYRWKAPVHIKEFDTAAESRRQITWDANGNEIRQVRQDVGTIENTILGMSTKRAHTAGVCMATGADEQFSLDTDDLDKAEVADAAKKKGRKQPQARAEAAKPPATEPKKEGGAPPSAQDAPEKAEEGGVAPDQPFDTFVVQEVKVVKEGKKKNGDPYTFYKITAGGLAWMTFSHTQAATAQECINEGKRAFLMGDKNLKGDFDLVEIKKTEIAA